jgi:N-acetylmuramic acid 6-phosphate (MurNAc-6-P) etherase
VQAMMAGGRDAIFGGSKEGVEDNYEEGARAMTRFHPTRATWSSVSRRAA